jgi:hypothetical protein
VTLFSVVCSANGVEERDDTSSLLTGRHGNSGLGVIERGSSGADGQVRFYLIALRNGLTEQLPRKKCFGIHFC